MKKSSCGSVAGRAAAQFGLESPHQVTSYNARVQLRGTAADARPCSLGGGSVALLVGRYRHRLSRRP
eukprot:1055854-Prymnesium_polylepis.2